MSATTRDYRAALGSTAALGAMVRPSGAVRTSGSFPGDGGEDAGSPEQVLRFERFPTVRSRPQRDADGHLWKIIKIEAPYCWAARHERDAIGRYRIEVARSAEATCRPPQMPAGQLRLL
jgi:hypothetical protein